MSDRSRRAAGAVIGLVLGLLYGLTSTLINAATLPGLPLRLDPARAVVGLCLTGLGVMAAGWLTAWPASAFKGIAAGAVAVALFGVVRALFAPRAGAEDLLRAVIILIPSILPAAAFAAPITGLLRLGVHLYGEALEYSGRDRLLRLGRLVAGVLVVGLLAGSLSRMSAAEQAALRQVNRMLQNGLAATADSGVPSPLRRIDNFRARARARYTLDARIDLSADASIAGSTAVETIVVDVLFDNGLRFYCLVGATLAEPLCAEPLP